MRSFRDPLSTAAHRVLRAARRRNRSAPRPGEQSAWSELDFMEQERFRPFDLLPAAGTFFSGDVLAAGEPRHIERGPLEAPFLTVELTPEPASTLSAAGIEGPTGSVGAEHDTAAAKARIVLRRADGEEVLAERGLRGTAERLAFTLTENIVTLWGETSGGWHVILTHRLSPSAGIDFRATGQITFSRLYYQGDFRHVRAGYFGYLGLRDPQLVRTPDGEPVRDYGRYWITATCAGPGFFPSAHWAVFSFAPDTPKDLRLESHLFFQRGGKRLGDHAGALLRDSHGSFSLGVSSWGDFDKDAHLRAAASGSDLLAGVHVLESRRWQLPTVHGAWDPSLLHYDGRWWLAFVECIGYSPRFTFRPALARTEPGAGLDSALELVGADPTLRQAEGTLLTLRGGSLYVLASDGDAGEYPVYDLDMQRVDTLRAPYPTNIPHPLVIDPDGEPFILTFNGTPHDKPLLGYGTHGDVVILRRRPSDTR